MTAPNDDQMTPERARQRPWALAALGLAVGWLLVRVPFGAAAAIERLPATWTEARAAFVLPADARIEHALGVPPRVAELLRRSLPEDGRLVVYSPYPGPAGDLVRLQYERLKNLLYPTPREARFARDVEELQQHVERRFERRLVVVDGTQESIELPVAARFELLHEQRIGAMRVRYWRLLEGGR